MKSIIIVFALALTTGFASAKSSKIDRGGGDFSVVKTDRNGNHSVRHSTGGGGQYGSGRSHEEVIKDQRPGKVTTRD